MLVIIIPVKPLRESKTRLAPVLPARPRAALCRRLLEQTILTATQVSRVVVISRSQAVRQTARRLGAAALVEQEADLNAAIRQGIAWTQAQGGSSVLILPFDLPLLTPPALAKLVEFSSRRAPAVVIAPCRHYQGTNALWLNPPTAITPRFGLASLAEHQQLACAAGLPAPLYHAPELAFDLDTPEDLRDLVTLKPDLLPDPL